MNHYFELHFDDDFYARAEAWDHAHDPDQLTVDEARARAALCDEARIERRHREEAAVLRRKAGERS